MRILIATVLIFALGLVAGSAGAEYPDWHAVEDTKVIEVLTHDESGKLRKTKVWFVLVDGVPYLRTNDSRWLANLRRDPDLGLRIEDREYEARAEEIPGDAIIEKVDRASAEKYGWQEKLIHVFRMKKPEILEITPRAGAS